MPFIIAGARAMSSSIDALVGFIHGSVRFLPQAFLFGKKKSYDDDGGYGRFWVQQKKG